MQSYNVHTAKVGMPAFHNAKVYFFLVST